LDGCFVPFNEKILNVLIIAGEIEYVELIAVSP
jgi:hypothetical protein